ncbi:hypothetical protein GTP45_07805 [Pseudoduganella sp. FT55W]|uniref:Uncharacterized protein n=1 Tax=Duganella rivi TaxID=2666083 RepID=A0A7X4GNI6_9BURK|nr:hypothetical protein [Duganella rivi]MYM66731.1 hypothetical protein [Duganella rivi]
MSTTQTFRPDHQSSEVVEAGIERADRVGPEIAAAYLSHRGVLESVIKRVVSEPEHRRNPGRLRSRDERQIEESSRSSKFKP